MRLSVANEIAALMTVALSRLSAAGGRGDCDLRPLPSAAILRRGRGLRQGDGDVIIERKSGDVRDVTGCDVIALPFICELPFRHDAEGEQVIVKVAELRRSKLDDEVVTS